MCFPQEWCMIKLKSKRAFLQKVKFLTDKEVFSLISRVVSFLVAYNGTSYYWCLFRFCWIRYYIPLPTFSYFPNLFSWFSIVIYICFWIYVFLWTDTCETYFLCFNFMWILLCHRSYFHFCFHLTKYPVMVLPD